MSFLSVLSEIGSITQRIVGIATSPAAVAIAAATPYGREYAGAVEIIVTLEHFLPMSGQGPAKAAVAIPAIQALLPGASTDSVSTLTADLVAAFKKFNAANEVKPA